MDSFPGPKSSSSTWRLCDTISKEVKNLLKPWVVSPKLALAVLEAEVGTTRHVSNLDALRCVQVVPGVLRVLLNRAG